MKKRDNYDRKWRKGDRRKLEKSRKMKEKGEN